ASLGINFSEGQSGELGISALATGSLGTFDQLISATHFLTISELTSGNTSLGGYSFCCFLLISATAEGIKRVPTVMISATLTRGTVRIFLTALGEMGWAIDLEMKNDSES